MRKLKMRNKVARSISISKSNSGFYDTDYANEFPVGNYYLHAHEVIPSYVEFKSKYKVEILDYFLDNDYEVIWKSKRVSSTSSVNLHGIVFEKGNLLVYVKLKSEKGHGDDFSLGLPGRFLSSENRKDGEADYATITSWYIDDGEIDKIAEDLKDRVCTSKSKSKISLLMATRMGMETIEQEIRSVDVDIESHYGSKFLPVHLKIVDRLSEERGKGLVLLHGIPGTGKTNYIRYLCGILEKEIIFLPPSMAEGISSPDFITFLLDHTNSILVIEDAEKVVLDREGENSSRQSVANLLNLTDGILSDCLSIQIIATFNTSRDRIDKALLRKGRLIAEWKFDALSVDDSNNLLKTLGKDPIATKPLTLTEIYNSDEEEYVQQAERQQIGFGR